MGVMAKELKKLRGRDSYLKVQEHLDTLSDAQVSRKVEDMNNTYLRELYYGLETLINRVSYQENMIKELVEKLEGKAPSMRVQLKKRKPKAIKLRPAIDSQTIELTRALFMIRNNLDENGRITWRKVDDPKKLIFAYIRKAESEGINIDSTMEMQKIPQYRRAFQYVAYNLGSWKDVVEQYRNQ